tara:strand:- start:334 stop:1125 length:792 start_codon:yes stop_codon:yes gene_type:complete
MTKIGMIVETILKKEVTDKEVAVLFSGGIDSLSLCFALEKLGKTIHTYTFKLDNKPNKDAYYSKIIAEKKGWNHTEIIVPTNNIKADFLKLTKQYNCFKKTQVECTFPFLYVFPKIKQNFIVCGSVVGHLYGLAKSCMIHWKTPIEKFIEYKDKYYSSPNPACVQQLYQLSKEYGKTLIVPFYDQKVFDFFRPLSWNEINKPFPKQHIVHAYTSQFYDTVVRKPANLQLESGIPFYFEQLLKDKDLNTKNRTRVMDLCRDYGK